MYSYGTGSSRKLATCHPLLSSIADRAIELSPYDITIVHGWRGEEVQNALFDSGASHKQWPESRHNAMKIDQAADPQNYLPESRALDFAPWVYGGIPWKETHIFAVIAGCFFAAAAGEGATIRWGGDWDTDGSTTDQTLMDYGHVELIL